MSSFARSSDWPGRPLPVVLDLLGWTETDAVRFGRHVLERCRDQIDRLPYDGCDLMYREGFAGFVEVYELARRVVPKWCDVVDLGSYYQAQALLFRRHKSYTGVDTVAPERVCFDNTRSVQSTIQDYVAHHADPKAFAVCSYVPDDGAVEAVRRAYPNRLVYYPGRLFELTVPSLDILCAQ